jgi:hypothetical protein
MESDPLMPGLQSDNPKVDTDNLASRLHAVLRELPGNSFTVGWAITALVATGGWLYFIARTAYFLFDWLLG